MKKSLPVLLALGLLAPALHAADNADSWSGFWQKMRLRIEQMTPQKKLATTTAVGGVRGSAVAASDVYWKGEAQPLSVDADELTAFQKAMALVETGQKDQAQVAFAEFGRTYPASPLKSEADQALARLLAGK
jgi:TolA-binding protein